MFCELENNGKKRYIGMGSNLCVHIEVSIEVYMGTRIPWEKECQLKCEERIR